MAIAYVQEFEIKNGDTSTTNYDTIVAELDLQDKPDGLLIHTAGFDHDAGVFRILDACHLAGARREIHERTPQPDH